MESRIASRVSPVYSKLQLQKLLFLASAVDATVDNHGMLVFMEVKLNHSKK